MKTELFKTPEIPPRIKAWKYQLIGMPLLVSIPILALLGFLGGTTKKIELNERDLNISLSYPELLRNGQTEYVRLKISNTSTEPLKNLKILLSHDFLQHFDEIESLPEFDKNLEVSLNEIPENGFRWVLFKLKANKIGGHSAKVEFKLPGQDAIETAFKTFVLP